MRYFFFETQNLKLFKKSKVFGFLSSMFENCTGYVFIKAKRSVLLSRIFFLPKSQIKVLVWWQFWYISIESFFSLFKHKQLKTYFAVLFLAIIRSCIRKNRYCDNVWVLLFVVIFCHALENFAEI